MRGGVGVVGQDGGEDEGEDGEDQGKDGCKSIGACQERGAGARLGRILASHVLSCGGT